MTKNQVLTSDAADVSEPKDKTTHIKDYELAQKAAGGDMKAFEEIYWKNHRCVFGICLRMTKNVAEAENVTQEVFVRLFRKINSFRGNSAFKTWLYRMTVNYTLMHFRANKSRKEEITEDGELPENDFARRHQPNDANQRFYRLRRCSF